MPPRARLVTGQLPHNVLHMLFNLPFLSSMALAVITSRHFYLRWLESPMIDSCGGCLLVVISPDGLNDQMRWI